jgi:hypothetical protein
MEEGGRLFEYPRERSPPMTPGGRGRADIEKLINDDLKDVAGGELAAGPATAHCRTQQNTPHTAVAQEDGLMTGHGRTLTEGPQVNTGTYKERSSPGQQQSSLFNSTAIRHPT